MVKHPKIRIGDLVAPIDTAPQSWQSTYKEEARWGKPAVSGSPDLKRILELPRRPCPKPGEPRSEALIELMYRRFSRENHACLCAEFGRECITRHYLVQAWALFEIGLCGGSMSPIPVGQGKTMLDIQAPLALKARNALLLIPPTLVDQLIAEYRLISQHFLVPSLVVHGKNVTVKQPGETTLHILPYSRLCRPEATDFLEKLRPDAIIADECHKLRHPNTATTSRVLRYFAAHPETKFCAWSGSVTDKSIKDYAHLSAFALRYGSPLPLEPQVVEDWARALDPSEVPAPAGALLKLCDPGEHVEEGFRRRLVETCGIVTATEPAVDAKLYISEREAPEIPESVSTALTALRGSWQRPDGEELVDALAVSRCARELACGFYYRWIFPRREPMSLILEWLAARKDWHKELRTKLKRRQEHLDSPHLCTRAAQRGWGETVGMSLEELQEHFAERIGRAVQHDDGECEVYTEADANRDASYEFERYDSLPTWKPETWPRWREAKGTVIPETQAVRVDDYLAQDAAAWGLENRGVVWYEHSAFGQWVSEISGLPLHGGGPNAGVRIASEQGGRSIVASIKSHGTGRDGLQRLFCTQLVANSPSSATAWEQLLGRLHRIGQQAERVDAFFYRHTPELKEHVNQALSRALYVEGTLGMAQKLQTGFDLTGTT